MFNKRLIFLSLILILLSGCYKEEQKEDYSTVHGIIVEESTGCKYLVAGLVGKSGVGVVQMSDSDGNPICE